jgi:Flp pilus assembly protein TadG
MPRPSRFRPSCFRDDTAGSVTVEFVALMTGFLLLVFFVVEVTLAFFWWQTAEKATYLGVRLAAVQDPAAAGVPLRNAKTTAGVFGVACRDVTSPCTLPLGTTQVCDTDGSGCVAAAKDAVVEKMQSLLAVIQPENVRITYRHVGLGYAGGPYVPAITVTLTGLPFQTGIIPILGSIIGTGGPLLTLPDISATLTGEDLSTAAVDS